MLSDKCALLLVVCCLLAGEAQPKATSDPGLHHVHGEQALVHHLRARLRRLSTEPMAIAHGNDQDDLGAAAFECLWILPECYKCGYPSRAVLEESETHPF